VSEAESYEANELEAETKAVKACTEAESSQASATALP